MVRKCNNILLAKIAYPEVRVQAWNGILTQQYQYLEIKTNNHNLHVKGTLSHTLPL
jgi:hypothetical protein